MKKIVYLIIYVFNLFIACTKYDDNLDRMILLSKLLDCNAGEMRCQNNNSQMCNADGTWETWQNCGSLGEQCYSTASMCSGYVGITCCR